MPPASMAELMGASMRGPDARSNVNSVRGAGLLYTDNSTTFDAVHAFSRTGLRGGGVGACVAAVGELSARDLRHFNSRSVGCHGPAGGRVLQIGRGESSESSASVQYIISSSSLRTAWTSTCGGYIRLLESEARGRTLRGAHMCLYVEAVLRSPVPVCLLGCTALGCGVWVGCVGRLR
jgi:hypothetical protein